MRIEKATMVTCSDVMYPSQTISSRNIYFRNWKDTFDNMLIIYYFFSVHTKIRLNQDK